MFSPLKVFTFVVKNRESVFIEGYVFATYGHNLKGNVIEHDFFGTEKVIDNLKKSETYKYGFVKLNYDSFKKNSNNNKINYIDISNNIIERMYLANL